MISLQPQKGRLLVAEPSILNDYSFNRSVILLTECDKDVTAGFILNRPLELKLNDLISEVDCSFTVYEGGPVMQDNLYFVHKVPSLIPESTMITNDIFLGGNFDSLKEVLNSKSIKNNDIRFFLGYSGWDINQLENEIKTDSWFVSENDFPNIFDEDNSSIWKNKLLQKGDKYKIWANAPSNVHLN